MTNLSPSCRPGSASPNGAAASSPRLRHRRYLGCQAQTSTTPTGLRLGRHTGHNPVGVGGWEQSFPQGSSCLATLGWRPQPRWGCQWQVPLSLAPGFSRVFSAVVSSSRFNGFGGAPLCHGPVGKPLKRLYLPMSPNTRLKPGANERGLIHDHRPTSPHLLPEALSSNPPWPVAHGLPATRSQSSREHPAVALVAGRMGSIAGRRARRATRRLGTRRARRPVAWPVQWCSCGLLTPLGAVEQDLVATPSTPSASPFLAGRPRGFDTQAAAIFPRTISPAAQRAARTQPRAERSDALGTPVPHSHRPEGARERSLRSFADVCFLMPSVLHPFSRPCRALSSGRAWSQGIVLPHSALGWTLTAFQAVLSARLQETELRPTRL